MRTGSISRDRADSLDPGLRGWRDRWVGVRRGRGGDMDLDVGAGGLGGERCSPSGRAAN